MVQIVRQFGLPTLTRRRLMRLGIFGGSFDPVHMGHLLVAETCREQCSLDAVWFLPASVPPHKQDRSLASDSDRVEMLRLAISGHAAFHVSTLELERGGVSYTVDTLSQIQDDHPEAELFFLMGADSLVELPTWKSPDRICKLATPLVVHRHGSPAPDFEVLLPFLAQERIDEISQHQVEMPVIDISSTDLRARAREGRSLRYQVPRAVEKYVETNSLYRE